MNKSRIQRKMANTKSQEKKNYVKN